MSKVLSMTISISVATLQRLTKHLKEGESEFDTALNRLMDKAERMTSTPPSIVNSAQSGEVKMAEWLDSEAKLPVGTKVYANYKRRVYEGVLGEKGLEYGGQTFPSLSAAAIHIVSQDGDTENPNRNGWRFWRFIDEKTGEYRKLNWLKSPEALE